MEQTTWSCCNFPPFFFFFLLFFGVCFSFEVTDQNRQKYFILKIEKRETVPSKILYVMASGITSYIYENTLPELLPYSGSHNFVYG